MQMIKREDDFSTLANRSLALRNIHDLTYRHLFVRHFISSIKNLRYAFLAAECETTTQLGYEQLLTIVIDWEEIYEWKAICKQVPFAQSSRLNLTSTSLHVYLTFEDQTALHIRLIYKLRRKDIVYNDAEQILKFARANHDGIKIAHFTHTFEYYYLSFCLDAQRIPDFASNFFRSLLPEARQQIMEYFSEKYYLSAKTLENLIESVKDCSTQIVHTLHHQPANRGMMRVQHKYSYFKDAFQRWFISV